MPEFERLGVILNEDAPLDELKMAEVETIKKKLISSEPFIPGVTENDPASEGDEVPVAEGIFAILIGVVIVAGIDYMRKGK
jgi:putative membrane protein